MTEVASGATASATHQVENQPPPLADYNLFDTDPVLQESMQREGAGWAVDSLREFGQRLGSAEVIEWGAMANEHVPVLKTHDARGHRIDQVVFHPAWHELMALSVTAGAHNVPWRLARPGSYVARAGLFFLASENDYGHCCPISMTCAAVPTLRMNPELRALWEPRIASLEYDPRFIPAAEKRGVTMGMAMTEKQGGSDVRANTTRAVPLSQRGPGREYRLRGHKWFCSAPMSDAFLVLAQTDGGLSCFLVPRWLADGRRNPFLIQRLKSKLGNRSNASAEVEFDNTVGILVTDEGRGVSSIMEMVNHTRLDCATGAAALMRQGLVQAIHHARHRAAFGRRLAEQPLMQSVLTDLCLESEAATVLTARLARAYDREEELSFRRLATAVGKYWLCKRAPEFLAEALECLGGNGYVEELPMARLYREAPVNSVWEGSGNVICLDVLRTMARDPDSTAALLEEVEQARGGNRLLDEHVGRLRGQLDSAAEDPALARLLVERMALALQASLLVRHSPSNVADAFCAARLAPDRGHSWGALPTDIDGEPIIERAFPAA